MLPCSTQRPSFPILRPEVPTFRLTTLTQTILADSGSRGDFVTVDPNGSLLITQTDRIMRLTAPTGGTFGDTPEPGSWALFVSGGLAGLGALRRCHAKRR